MKTYRFFYSATVFDKTRTSVKGLKAYAWNDAAYRLAKHVGFKWTKQPFIEVHNAEVDGILINPDLLPEINALVNVANNAGGTVHRPGGISS